MFTVWPAGGGDATSKASIDMPIIMATTIDFFTGTERFDFLSRSEIQTGTKGSAAFLRLMAPLLSRFLSRAGIKGFERFGSRARDRLSPALGNMHRRAAWELHRRRRPATRELITRRLAFHLPPLFIFFLISSIATHTQATMQVLHHH